MQDVSDTLSDSISFSENNIKWKLKNMHEYYNDKIFNQNWKTCMNSITIKFLIINKLKTHNIFFHDILISNLRNFNTIWKILRSSE